jgi:quercetin dioxygenase-like cupin family protein
LKLADIVAPAEKSFPPGFTYLANGSGEWRELPVKGARVKELSDDRSDGFTTMLLEMDAGARFPGHHHHGAEQVYLLDGDLYSDGEELSPGDFLRAAADTHHGGLYSKNGCHALIITAGGKRPLSVGESGEKCRIHVDGSDGISIGPAKGTGRSGVACAKAPAKDAVGGRITGRWDDSQDNQQEMLHHPAIRVGQESRGNRKEVPGNPEEHAECFSSLF